MNSSRFNTNHAQFLSLKKKHTHKYGQLVHTKRRGNGVATCFEKGTYSDSEKLTLAVSTRFVETKCRTLRLVDTYQITSYLRNVGIVNWTKMMKGPRKIEGEDVSISYPAHVDN